MSAASITFKYTTRENNPLICVPLGLITILARSAMKAAHMCHRVKSIITDADVISSLINDSIRQRRNK